MVPDPDEELRKKTEATSRKREVADFCRAESECDKALHRLKVQQRRSRRITKRTSQVRTVDGRRSVPSSGGGQTDQVLLTRTTTFFFSRFHHRPTSRLRVAYPRRAATLWASYQRERVWLSACVVAYGSSHPTFNVGCGAGS